MNARTERVDPVIAELYKHKPHSLDVYTADDDKPRKVPLGGRNRWSKVKQTLDALNWTRIVALDVKGGVLTAIEPDADGDDGQGDDLIDALTISERMSHVVTDAIARTQKEVRMMFADQIEANGELLRAMTEGIRAINEAYVNALKVQAAYAVPVPHEDTMDDKMKAAAMGVIAKQFGIPPELAAMFGARAFGGGPPPPQAPQAPRPPNGANGTPKPPQPGGK